MTPYEWGKEVVPGLLAVETAGHTPGHTSYVLSSGSGKVFIQSDVTNIPYLFAANPGWHAFFDQDPAMAEAARRKTYDMRWRTSSRCRASIFRSRGSAMSKRTATATGWSRHRGIR